MAGCKVVGCGNHQVGTLGVVYPHFLENTAVEGQGIMNRHWPSVSIEANHMAD